MNKISKGRISTDSKYLNKHRHSLHQINAKRECVFIPFIRSITILFFYVDKGKYLLDVILF